MIITKIRTLHENFQGYKVTVAFSDTPFLAFAYTKTKRIYVSELFLETYSKEEQTAILAHEVGHLVLHANHLSGTRTLYQELEADRYSADMIGFKAMCSAIKQTIALANKRYKEGLSNRAKYQRQQMEYSHRISNMLDYIKGKTVTLDYARENLS